MSFPLPDFSSTYQILITTSMTYCFLERFLRNIGMTFSRLPHGIWIKLQGFRHKSLVLLLQLLYAQSELENLCLGIIAASLNLHR